MEIVDREEAETGSDHDAIFWRASPRIEPASHGDEDLPAMEWGVARLLALKRMRETWEIIGRYPLPSHQSREELEEQAEAIQNAIIIALDRYASHIRMCARSERWSDEIVDATKEAGRARKL